MSSISSGCLTMIVISSAYSIAVVLLLLRLTFIPCNFLSRSMRRGFMHVENSSILSGHPCRSPLSVLIGFDL